LRGTGPEAGLRCILVGVAFGEDPRMYAISMMSHAKDHFFSIRLQDFSLVGVCNYDVAVHCKVK